MKFHEYMRSQFQQNNVRIADVVRSSGISKGHLYNIVSGRKHTAIKDYVIAMCRGASMDLTRTQLALELNGMDPLDYGDLRDSCIIRCINDNRNIRMLNQSLEDEGLEELKMSRVI